MNDLISRNALIAESNKHFAMAYFIDKEQFLNLINEQPPIETVPVAKVERILEQLEEELNFSTHNYKEEELSYRKGIRYVRRLIKQGLE